MARLYNGKNTSDYNGNDNKCDVMMRLKSLILSSPNCFLHVSMFHWKSRQICIQDNGNETSEQITCPCTRSDENLGQQNYFLTRNNSFVLRIFLYFSGTKL